MVLLELRVYLVSMETRDILSRASRAKSTWMVVGAIGYLGHQRLRIFVSFRPTLRSIICVAKKVIDYTSIYCIGYKYLRCDTSESTKEMKERIKRMKNEERRKSERNCQCRKGIEMKMSGNDVKHTVRSSVI